MKKIALIVDVMDWAYSNIARNIKENLKNDFDIDIYAFMDLECDMYRLIFALKDYDLVHIFWRKELLYFLDNKEILKSNIKNSLGDFNEFKDRFINNKVFTTSVYDHLFIDSEFEVTKKLFDTFKYYTVCNKKLLDIYNGMDIKYKPTMEITDGVLLSKFKPSNLERFSNISKRKIVIGWVGNSKWAKSKYKKDFKGVETILKPVINELKEEGYKIELKLADSSVKKIPLEKMPEYYSKIDLYICTSLIEGTPNPVLEAMACGIPVISTDVGIVPEVFGEKQSEFILRKRTKNELKSKIIKIYNNPKMFGELSKENLESIKNWDWSIKAKQFKDFFEIALNNKNRK